MKITTAQLKQELKKRGYTNPKRITKRKDQNQNWLREFSTDQGTITVQTDSNDQNIINVSAPASPSSLKHLKKITYKSLENYLEEGDTSAFDDQIKNMQATVKEIYPLPEVNSKMVKEEYGMEVYEAFLVITDKSTFVWDSYYDQIIDVSKFNTAQRDIKGIWVGDDFMLTDPNYWIEMDIPKGTLTTYFGPEYMKLLMLSSDLKKGLTTVAFNAEPIVSTQRKDLIKEGYQKTDLDNYNCGDRNAFDKMFKKYDFINDNT